ncbi:MAG: hypothetical protein R3C03_03275 [Pirellulaceae bacterium]
MKNRIQFVGNPWPNGHLIKELVWTARINLETGLWFDLHLVSDDYYAEDDNPEEDEEEDPESDWCAKIVWNNYHNCTLSSTYWGSAGFLVATEKEPLDFDKLADRIFNPDPAPPPTDCCERAFGIYLLGHDGVADHEILFSPNGKNTFELNWRGKIAMEYVGDESFDYSFVAHYDQLTFSGIQMPKGVSESQAKKLAKRYLADVNGMTLKKKNELWLVPDSSI